MAFVIGPESNSPQRFATIAGAHTCCGVRTSRTQLEGVKVESKRDSKKARVRCICGLRVTPCLPTAKLTTPFNAGRCVSPSFPPPFHCVSVKQLYRALSF